MFDMIGGRGGVGGVEGLLGRMGVGGGDGRFSSMLTIGLHVKDTTNYVKCLGISHNAAILEKCVMSLFTFLDPLPSWNKCVMSQIGRAHV